MIQAVVKKLADQAALSAAVIPAGPLEPLHQIGGGFATEHLLRIAVNVNWHVVKTADDTVLIEDETPVYDGDLSDEKGDLARYALLSLSGCRG